MLMQALKPMLPVLKHNHRHERRRHVERPTLPALHLVVSSSKLEDWRVQYPCIRMHGAAFESEFYARGDEIQGS